MSHSDGEHDLDATLAAGDTTLREAAAPSSGSDTLAATASDLASMRSVRSPADDPSEPPKRIGRFHVLRRLGMGGMGVVFAGFDVELDRKVAIKLLLVDSREGSIGHTRIMREAQAMARLSHPNVLPIYEIGVYAGQVFLAMEFVQGQTLTAWQAERPRAWRETLSMYVQAARGLAAAHAAGIVHRDFKPESGLESQVLGNTRDSRLRCGCVPTLYQAEGPVKRSTRQHSWVSGSQWLARRRTPARRASARNWRREADKPSAFGGDFVDSLRRPQVASSWPRSTASRRPCRAGRGRRLSHSGIHRALPGGCEYSLGCS